MLVNKTSAVLLIAFTAACGSSSGTEDAPVQQRTVQVQSEFQTPATDGSIDADFIDGPPTITSMEQNADGDGYAFVLGPTLTGGYGAASGLLPGTTVADAPTTGAITYNAQYEVRALVNIREVDGGFRANGGVGGSGDIVLTADFEDLTLTGEAATGTAAEFSVDGVLDGSDVAGTVTFLGIDGDLTGLAGADQVVGAFHGSSNTAVYSGGLIGDAATE